MFENVCAIPLDHDLFAQAVHPQAAVVTVGLASGHIHSYTLPTGVNDNGEQDVSHVVTAWKTRRHKGSCRALAYSVDGSQLYSAGADGIVKLADSATGQVTAKMSVPRCSTSDTVDAPTLLHALSPQSLILATDSSALHVYDTRQLNGASSMGPQITHNPHDDYVTSLTPLPPSQASTSGFSKQWLTTGGSTLAITDLRKGVVARSEDQEQELLSSLIVTGLSTKGTNVGEKVIVGAGNGALTLWERGVWDDQDERIIVDRSTGGGESLDALALLPAGVGPSGKVVAVGMGNGVIRLVKIGQNKIISELKHDDLSQEGVIGLAFDVAGRMISGGGTTVKVWTEQTWQDTDDENEPSRNALTADNSSWRKHSTEVTDEDAEENSSEVVFSSKRKEKKRKKNTSGNQQSTNGILHFSGLT